MQGALIRVMGYVFVYEPLDEKFTRRPEIRMRVFNCGDGGLIVNILPPTTELDKVGYTLSNEKHLVATDGRDLRLDINEFSDRR